MYIPKHFLETDADKLAAFIDAHAFGALVTIAAGRPFATHIPFVYERHAGRLFGHVARANPQWQHLTNGADALVMFQGPHAYISPTWYVTPGVPTWDYVAVHVYGSARAIEDKAVTKRHVEQLAARYESGNQPPWVPEYDERNLHGIVAIEIRIKEIQGKFKVSQNRPAGDRARVAAKLQASGSENDLAVARLIPLD
ncbi:MAG TPA: FMN-binding negative transcriptional regulator [Gammaproteobacteria bacterium]|nr:FMN-binding negative transcriptional regulator [Gammaproteobacteria bacterium]